MGRTAAGDRAASRGGQGRAALGQGEDVLCRLPDGFLHTRGYDLLALLVADLLGQDHGADEQTSQDKGDGRDRSQVRSDTQVHGRQQADGHPDRPDDHAGVADEERQVEPATGRLRALHHGEGTDGTQRDRGQDGGLRGQGQNGGQEIVQHRNAPNVSNMSLDFAQPTRPHERKTGLNFS